jgi:hypothetical protein
MEAQNKIANVLKKLISMRGLRYLRKYFPFQNFRALWMIVIPGNSNRHSTLTNTKQNIIL